MKRFYYQFTALIPRRLPFNETEWAKLQDTLVKYFGVKNAPQVWATVAGHVNSTAAGSIRRSYAFLANVAKRQDAINPAANAIRAKAIRELEAKLAEKMAEQVALEEKEKADATAASQPTSETSAQSNVEGLETNRQAIERFS